MKIFLTVLLSVFVLIAQDVCAKESLSFEEILVQDEELMSMIENSIFDPEELMKNLEESLDEFQRFTEEFLQIEADRQNKEAEKRLREAEKGWERIQEAVKESEVKYRLR